MLASGKEGYGNVVKRVCFSNPSDIKYTGHLVMGIDQSFLHGTPELQVCQTVKTLRHLCIFWDLYLYPYHVI